MNNFEVKIEYEHILNNYTGIGRGMRGTIFNYQGDIVKIQKSHCDNIKYYRFYLNQTYTLTNNDKNYIDKYKKLASVVNNLAHFIKIKGVLICPNLSGKKVFAKCVYRSIIYENEGQLTRKKLPFDKKNALQLLKIFESFKKFNLARWFHEDIQGCNNIEPNQFDNLYVIDYEDLNCFNDCRITLHNISIDIYKMFTCIWSSQENKIIVENSNFAFKIYLIILIKYLERKPISYQRSDFNDKRVVDVIVKGGIIYNQERSNYIENDVIPEINIRIDECVKILESIKNIQVNICEFRFLMENSIENYVTIMDFILKIKNYLNPEDYKKIKKCIETIVKKIKKIFYEEPMYFNFEDIKYIIEYIYDKEITKYKNDIEKYFK